MTEMRCRDIPEEPILRKLLAHAGGIGIGWHDLEPREDYCPTVRDAMPPDLPDNLVLAKMHKLVRRGLVDGCCCGCRGDFKITAKGRESIND